MTAAVDRALDPYVATEQKLREKAVRRGSPHEVVGPLVARKLFGRRPTPLQRRASKLAFGLGYGLLWGAIHALARRSFPTVSRPLGVPFAVPFFLACDGAVAPLLGLTPTPARVPSQLNLKELANHIAWTMTADAVHRSARRLGI